ncbi:SAF domain-containing protein [Paenarthrobacter ilicis]|uniref:SAF domain-containing protein n=1 Tax=Paenarthrobacter ilicis TaxID=43665 RepID=UPI0028CFF1FF|nr:SAF domain-containing protein [Paenarthrobacter ilicis]
MSSSPAVAPRLKKPSWKDPRLLIGVLLVLASIAGVVVLVGSADKTIQVFAAREEISVGQPVTPEDLIVVEVRLDGIEAGYFTVEQGFVDGGVAVQRVGKNQLVPQESIGKADALNRKPVAIALEEDLPPQAVAGARVDVWVALPGSGKAYDDPQLLLPGAEIAQVTSGATTLGASRAKVILVLVTDQQMPGLLGALANEAKVSVVWNPAGGVL